MWNQNEDSTHTQTDETVHASHRILTAAAAAEKQTNVVTTDKEKKRETHKDQCLLLRCVWNMCVVAFGRAFGLRVACAFDLRVCIAFVRLFNTLGAFGQCVCKRSVCVQTQARR